MVVGDVTTGAELVVVGAGPAGYAAATRGGQLGLDVTLVEKDAVGGTCLNRGCIPSKALITGTRRAHRLSEAEHMGIHADPSVDLAAMVEWKDGVVEKLTGGVEGLCKRAGVDLVEGRAVFEDEGRLRVEKGGDGQGSDSIEFEHCIVATGSRPLSIPNFDYEDEPVLSAADALSLERTPDSLVVVGGGYIGLELAGVFANLGTDVTVVEALDQVLPQFEPDVAAVVRDRLEDLGVDIHVGYGASEWAETDDGGVAVRATPAQADGGTEPAAAGADADGEPLDILGDYVLVAVGRRPNTEGLNLEAAGLETTEDGVIPTDDRCRTEVEGVYAAGDVAGEPMLAHAGTREGVVAAEVIAGEPAALDHVAVPAAVFTEPEVATVGMTADEAAEAGYQPVTGRFPFSASGRALAADETDGFARVVGDEQTGLVLGAQIVGPEASELIAEVTHALEMGATLEDLGATIHTHPTLSEAVMEAAELARGQAIHAPND